MQLNSPIFLLFLAVTATVYLLLKGKIQKYFLLVASYVFYAWAMPEFLPLVAATTLVAFFAAKIIEKQGKASKAVFCISVVLLLAVLVLFKYSKAIIPLFCTQAKVSQWVLPLGISFYTFQIVGYLVDVSNGKVKAERNIGVFALYVSFFPQVISGPIGRAGELLPQYHETQRFERARVTDGIQRLLEGAFRKVVIADSMAMFVNAVLDNLESYRGLALIAAVLGYAMQLYFDFSGYSSMAVGAAKILGIELRENFRAPYLASNMSTFWSRWHISLTSWLQDYLFVPLVWSRWYNKAVYGKKADEKVPAVLVNLLVVFAVSGIWHGSTLGYLVWGLLNGFYRIVEELIHKWLGRPKKLKNPTLEGVRRVVKAAFIYLIWSLSLIFFRMPRISEAMYVLKNLFGGLSLSSFEVEVEMLCQNLLPFKSGMFAKLFFAALFIFIVLAFVYEIKAERITKKNTPYRRDLVFARFRWAKYYIMMASIMFFYMFETAIGSTASFVYGGF